MNCVTTEKMQIDVLEKIQQQQREYLITNGPDLFRLLSCSTQFKGAALKRLLTYAAEEFELMGLTPISTALSSAKAQMSASFD